MCLVKVGEGSVSRKTVSCCLLYNWEDFEVKGTDLILDLANCAFDSVRVASGYVLELELEPDYDTVIDFDFGSVTGVDPAEGMGSADSYYHDVPGDDHCLPSSPCPCPCPFPYVASPAHRTMLYYRIGSRLLIHAMMNHKDASEDRDLDSILTIPPLAFFWNCCLLCAKVRRHILWTLVYIVSTVVQRARRCLPGMPVSSHTHDMT